MSDMSIEKTGRSIFILGLVFSRFLLVIGFKTGDVYYENNTQPFAALCYSFILVSHISILNTQF